MTTPVHQRRWRTLVRLEAPDRAVVPAWDGTVEVPVTPPPAVLEKATSFPYWCMARVNTGAEIAPDLIFSDWEPK